MLHCWRMIEVKKAVKLFAIAILSVLAATVLSGCDFGPASVNVKFIPDPVRIAKGETINANLQLTLNGIGRFYITKVLFEFRDAEEAVIDPLLNPGLPKEQVLDEPIPAFGAMGAIISVSIDKVLSQDQLTPPDDWWYPGAPHPASMKITFLDASENPRGNGITGLVWDPAGWELSPDI